MPALGNTTARGLGYRWQLLRTEAKRVYPWVCHLCGQPIPQHTTDQRWRWTLDHLTPRKHAGPSVPTIHDVRPAHAKCNSARGARPITQARTPHSRRW